MATIICAIARLQSPEFDQHMRVHRKHLTPNNNAATFLIRQRCNVTASSRVLPMCDARRMIREVRHSDARQFHRLPPFPTSMAGICWCSRAAAVFSAGGR
jgi:hypothetical protein